MGKIDFASGRKTVTVEVPELDTSFRLRALSMGQMNSLKTGDDDSGVKQLALSIVDESGLRIYTSDEDIPNLREMSLGVFKLLIGELNKLHGITKEDTEEAVKKLEASRNTDSGSD